MKQVSLLLLFILPLLLRAQEKVFFNAKIFTADRAHPFAEAVATRGKWIVAVGNYNDVKRSVSKNAQQIDLGARGPRILAGTSLTEVLTPGAPA